MIIAKQSQTVGDLFIDNQPTYSNQVCRYSTYQTTRGSFFQHQLCKKVSQYNVCTVIFFELIQLLMNIVVPSIDIIYHVEIVTSKHFTHIVS